jgi:hypothetical protein
MSQERLPPPQPEDCLISSRKSRCKGGTIIAEDVWTPAEHGRRVRCPDGYRPDDCARCGHDRLHVHDYLERKPIGLLMHCVLPIVRFICANPRCGATWRIVPAFLARHLWWSWERIVAGTAATTTTRAAPASVEVPPQRPVPEATRRRWLERLGSSARQLLVLLSTTGTAVVRAVAAKLDLDATRQDLIAAYVAALQPAAGARLASIGALVDRLERGIRLM